MSYALFFDQRPPHGQLEKLNAVVWNGESGDLVHQFSVHKLDAFLSQKTWWYLRFKDENGLQERASMLRDEVCSDLLDGNHWLQKSIELGANFCSKFGFTWMSSGKEDKARGIVIARPVIQAPRVVSAIIERIKNDFDFDFFIHATGGVSNHASR